MRITIFDQISAIGGTLGLFTGVSLITFVEVIYWLVRFPSSLFGPEKSNGYGKDNMVRTLEGGGNTKTKAELSTIDASSLGPRYGFT